MEIFLWLLVIMLVFSLFGKWAEHSMKPMLEDMERERRLKKGDTKHYRDLWVKAQEDEKVSNVVRKVCWRLLGAFLLLLTYCIGGTSCLMGIIIVAVLLLLADRCM